MSDECRRGTVDAFLADLGENDPRYVEPTPDEPRRPFRLAPATLTSWQGQDRAAGYE